MTNYIYTTNGFDVFNNNAPGMYPKVLSNNASINGVSLKQYPNYDPDTGTLKYIPDKVTYGDYIRSVPNRSDVRASIPTTGMDQFKDQPVSNNYLGSISSIASGLNAIKAGVQSQTSQQQTSEQFKKRSNSLTAREQFRARRQRNNQVPKKEGYCGCLQNRMMIPNEMISIRTLIVVILVIMLAIFLYKYYNKPCTRFVNNTVSSNITGGFVRGNNKNKSKLQFKSFV